MSAVSATEFNADELRAQALAGGGPRGSGIRDFLPEQHRQFLSQLSFVFAGATDAQGWPLATLLIGQPGFLQSPDPRTLHIAALPDAEDPANEALSPNREIGILGIDFSTRRRNRVNGHIVARDSSGIRIAVGQSFGNCPQYIQMRVLAPHESDPAPAMAEPIETLEHLDAPARAAILAADTFFVASRSRPGDGAEFGADISHRGGRPGFVQVDGDQLTIPDFRGNRYFNTLGNLIAEPRASLLFVDFTTGDLLQLQGRAEVDWNGAAAGQLAGAERLWRFHVTRGWRRRSATRLRWSFIEYSRTTLQTGLWRGRTAPP